MDLGLRDRVVVVTGATGGIGGQVARRFLEEGSRVALVDRAAPAGVPADRGRTISITCDVRHANDITRMTAEVLDAFGRIDVLVNGAGVLTWKPLLELDESEWDRMMEVNLKGTFLCCKAVAPGMVARRSGKIVNIASGLGHTPSVDVGHYAASKAGVIALTKTLALELAPHRINVNGVAPGIVDTPLIAPRRSRDELVQVGAHIPLGRVGQPDDIAKVVVLLASSATEYMTGQTLFINGGALMP
ncbi:MAG TPA: 3-oxoacyl-ACP reductase family protein [bacterium]|nr:3-oxoacyl-ACP reductase family protein [bacterium]